MTKYIFKRLLLIIPTLLLVIFIVFSIMAMTPGDPGRLILGTSAPQTAVDELNETLGYNDPFLLRFGNYIKDVLHGDFGNSYRTGRPVFEEIFNRFPVTLRLAVLSILLTSVVGITFGIISAVKQYSLVDYTCSVTAMFMSAIPVFWFGMMMMLVFSLKLGWLPSSGLSSWKSYILPVISISLPYSALVMRMTRSAMLDTVRQDYIRTARAKGAPERQVILRHALRNALLPVITVIGTTFGLALGGAVLTESVFTIPGVGTLIVDAIKKKDIPQVMASIIFLSAMFCIVILLVDILYAYTDPRIKALYKKER
ncbi:MAG: ABC transporter permease [Oscillospiraceae bacterium]